MLAGSFRFGTLASYRGSEADPGLLSDSGEGRQGTSFNGSLNNVNFKVGTNEFHIGKASGNALLRVNSNIDVPVFCASVGPYSPARHRSILHGDTSLGYQPNPGLSSFVVIDLQRFLQAMTEAFKEVWQGATFRQVSRMVHYGGRDRNVDATHQTLRDNQAIVEMNSFRAVFTKPMRFALEEEVRCAAFPAQLTEIQPVITGNLSQSVQNLFRMCMDDEGKDYAV